MDGTRGLSAGFQTDPRALIPIADLTSRNMEPTRLDRRSAVEPVRRTSSAGSAGVSGAHSALSLVRAAGSVRPSPRRGRKARGFGVLFHV